MWVWSIAHKTRRFHQKHFWVFARCYWHCLSALNVIKRILVSLMCRHVCDSNNDERFHFLDEKIRKTNNTQYARRKKNADLANGQIQCSRCTTVDRIPSSISNGESFVFKVLWISVCSAKSTYVWMVQRFVDDNHKLRFPCTDNIFCSHQLLDAAIGPTMSVPS